MMSNKLSLNRAALLLLQPQRRRRQRPLSRCCYGLSVPTTTPTNTSTSHPPPNSVLMRRGGCYWKFHHHHIGMASTPSTTTTSSSSPIFVSHAAVSYSTLDCRIHHSLSQSSPCSMQAFHNDEGKILSYSRRYHHHHRLYPQEKEDLRRSVVISSNNGLLSKRFFHTTTTRRSSKKSDDATTNHKNGKKQNGSFSSSSSSESSRSVVFQHAHLQLDYFGEPVSFLRNDNPNNDTTSTNNTDTSSSNDNNSSSNNNDINDKISNAMAAMDAFSLAIVSRGQTCRGGGGEDGLEAKSAHSVAITWSECIRQAAIWNQTTKTTKAKTQDGVDDKEQTNDNKKKGNDRYDDDIFGNNNNNDQNASSSSSSTANNNEKLPKLDSTLISAAPMLVVAAVGPLLAQTGLGYTCYVDHLLSHAKTGVDGVQIISLLDMARNVTQQLTTCRQLYPRERWHLRALDCMLRQEHRKAMNVYVKLLHSCPGDALALALAIDLAHKLGDRDGAIHAAGTVAAYWNDRRAAGFRPNMPGHFMVFAWVALGYAAGGRCDRAELWADQALTKDKRRAGGVATWALAHVYDADGRTSEGISFLANSEGRQTYEKCGLLFFQCLLGGYGAHFSIDREGFGRVRSQAFRLYITEFQRVLEYSGFATGKPWQEPQLKAPWGFREVVADAVKSNYGSFWSSLLGGSSSRRERDTTSSSNDGKGQVEEALPATDERWYGTSLKAYKMEPTCEDVLCWLPPTPQMLTQATLLLFRLTINGTIPADSPEWDKVRNAWSCLHKIQTMAGGVRDDTYPLAVLASKLVSIGSATPRSDDDENDNTMSTHGHVAEGLRLMGEILDLGNTVAAKATEGGWYGGVYALQYSGKHEHVPSLWAPEDDVSRGRWKQVVNHLYTGVGGTYWSGLLGDDTSLEEPDLDMMQKVEGWEMDIRPVLEHAICFAACKSGDMDALFLARAVCSKSVMMRPNSPEEWWRYSMVLTLLGDEVAAEDALEASIGFGSGQGQRY